MADNSSASASPLLIAFGQYLTTEKQLSAYTVRNYLFELKRTEKLFAENEHWLSVDHDALQAIVAKLHRKGLSPRSLSLTLSSLNQFFEFLLKEQKILINPAANLNAPKQAKPLPKNMDADSVTHLLEIDAHDPLSYRDKAIMELFYSSGLRLAELAALNIHDIQFSPAEVKVFGKGGKERIVPVGRFAVTAITQWLEVRKDITCDDDALFVTAKGRRLAHRSIQARLAKWGQEQALSMKVHPHKLRHSFATHML